MSIYFAGILAAVAMIFLFMKLGMRKVLGYDVLVDIVFTGGLAWMLSGTYSGMMAALLGGAVLSIFLFVAKWILGYERLTWYNGRLRWRTYS